MSTSKRFFCNFDLENVIISQWGSLRDEKTSSGYSFRDKTVSGVSTGEGRSLVHVCNVMSQHEDHPNTMSRDSLNGAEVYPIVIPIRMRWDDCFNHVSFQTVPMIAHVLELMNSASHIDISEVYWHASHVVSNLLTLLGIPDDRIIKEKEVRARRVLFPWVQNWCPTEASTFRGIAANVSATMTRNLLTSGPRLGTNFTDEEIGKPVGGRRTIVYLDRPEGNVSGIQRVVVNRDEIIDALRDEINGTNYEFIVLPSLKGRDVLKHVHESWRASAELVHNAYVMIGPHGGAFNNMIWAPDDVHMVEFNEMPSKQGALTGPSRVRKVFLWGHWMHTKEGKFWVVDPSIKHSKDVYGHTIRVCPREVLQVLSKIDEEAAEAATAAAASEGNDAASVPSVPKMLREGFDLNKYPIHQHTTFYREVDMKRFTRKPTKAPT
jgi:hypothetical protein